MHHLYNVFRYLWLRRSDSEKLPFTLYRFNFLYFFQFIMWNNIEYLQYFNLYLGPQYQVQQPTQTLIHYKDIWNHQ